MSGYYATAAIFYTNAATDGRVAFLSFGADSVIGGRPQIQVPSLGHRTLPILVCGPNIRVYWSYIYGQKRCSTRLTDSVVSRTVRSDVLTYQD
jgi:hypothetical protein